MEKLPRNSKNESFFPCKEEVLLDPEREADIIDRNKIIKSLVEES